MDRLNRSVAERTKHIPPDPALAYHIGKEIRDSLSDVRKQAEAAREPGKPYQDPIEALYLKCCHEYTGDKEPFIQAVSNAPYPIALLSEDIVDKGRQIIRKVISPELSHAIECQRCLKAMFSELDQAVQEIIADPLRQAVRREEHMAVADGTARIVAG